MPRITHINEVQELDPEEQIRHIKGRIKVIHKTIKGTNDRGDWTIQNFVITDGKNEIGVFNGGEPIDASWKGRWIMMECTKTKRGWGGVFAYDDDYNDTITRKVKLTPVADVFLIEDNGEEAHHDDDGRAEDTRETRRPNRPEEPAERGQTASRPAQTQAPAKPAAPAKLSGIEFAMQGVNQAANLLALCIHKVETYLAPRVAEKCGRELSNDERQKYATTLFIQTQKEFVMHMPRVELTKKPAAAATPAKSPPTAPNPPPEPARRLPTTEEVAQGIESFSDGSDGFPEGTPLSKDGRPTDDIPF